MKNIISHLSCWLQHSSRTKITTEWKKNIKISWYLYYQVIFRTDSAKKRLETCELTISLKSTCLPPYFVSDFIIETSPFVKLLKTFQCWIFSNFWEKFPQIYPTSSCLHSKLLEASLCSANQTINISSCEYWLDTCNTMQSTHIWTLLQL